MTCGRFQRCLLCSSWPFPSSASSLSSLSSPSPTSLPSSSSPCEKAAHGSGSEAWVANGATFGARRRLGARTEGWMEPHELEPSRDVVIVEGRKKGSSQRERPLQ